MKRKYLAEETIPTADEQALIHNLYLESLSWKRSGGNSADVVMITDTVWTNIEMMQPQVCRQTILIFICSVPLILLLSCELLNRIRT